MQQKKTVHLRGVPHITNTNVANSTVQNGIVELIRNTAEWNSHRRTTFDATVSPCSACSAERRLTRDVVTTITPAYHSNVIKFTADCNDRYTLST